MTNKTFTIGGQTFPVRYFYRDDDGRTRVVIEPGEFADALSTTDNPFGDDFLLTQGTNA